MGASEANLELNVSGQVTLETKGASKVEMRGNCKTLKLTGLGACKIEAENLKANNVDVHVSGASHAQVYASESLNAEAYGASEIECQGHPRNVKKTDNIGSSIHVE